METRTVGSNPTLSAIFLFLVLLLFFPESHEPRVKNERLFLSFFAFGPIFLSLLAPCPMFLASNFFSFRKFTRWQDKNGYFSYVHSNLIIRATRVILELKTQICMVAFVVYVNCVVCRALFQVSFNGVNCRRILLVSYRGENRVELREKIKKEIDNMPEELLYRLQEYLDSIKSEEGRQIKTLHLKGQYDNINVRKIAYE